jgi:hypothetical protein
VQLHPHTLAEANVLLRLWKDPRCCKLVNDHVPIPFGSTSHHSNPLQTPWLTGISEVMAVKA